MMSEKKKKCRGGWLGYCPFSEFESQYNKVYCDTGTKGRTWPGATRPVKGHDKADLSGGRAAARSRMAWPLGCVAIQSFVS